MGLSPRKDPNSASVHTEEDLLAWRRYKLAVENVLKAADNLHNAAMFSEAERNEISALDDQVIHFLNFFNAGNLFAEPISRGKASRK